MPAVAIVVPSYNHGRYLRACLRSVLDQTFEDWELALVDDNSTDDSLEVARSFNDPRIGVYQNASNLGTYGNQNRGVSLTTAPLVAILNSDDVWHPDKLAKQVAALDAHPEATLCFTLGERIDDEGRVRDGEDNHGDWPRGPVVDLFPYLLEQNNLLASSVVFRRPHARFDATLRFSGDWMAAFHAAWAGPALCLAESLTQWRIHADSTHAKAAPVMQEEVRVRKAILAAADRWRARGPQPLADQKLGACGVHLAALLVRFGNRREGKAVAYRAWREFRYAPARNRYLATCLPGPLAYRRLWGKAPRFTGGDPNPLELPE